METRMQFHWGPALACKQGQLSALREPVDAAEVEFAFWIVERLGKTKWGVGKIQIAVAVKSQSRWNIYLCSRSQYSVSVIPSGSRSRNGAYDTRAHGYLPDAIIGNISSI